MADHDPVRNRLQLLGAAAQAKIEVVMIELAAEYEAVDRGVEYTHADMIGTCMSALMNRGISFDHILNHVEQAKFDADTGKNARPIGELLAEDEARAERDAAAHQKWRRGLSPMEHERERRAFADASQQEEAELGEV